MGLTPLKGALVSGGLPMTYKVHNPRAPRRCGTRQHFSHGLLLWGRSSLSALFRGYGSLVPGVWYVWGAMGYAPNCGGSFL
uniref:Uncharacterized protein n=1 Tax=Fagus sylvatica TaxID=28930 RepID=A0A2N9G0P4_FAGSY